jgi:hypothetical protein
MANYDDSELSKALRKIDEHLSGGSDTTALRGEVETLTKSVDALSRELDEQAHVTQAQMEELWARCKAEAHRQGIKGRKATARLARGIWQEMQALRPHDRDDTGAHLTNAGGESRSDMSKSLISKTISADLLGQVAPMLKVYFPRGAAKVPYDKAIASKLVMCKALSLAEAQLWAKTNLVPADSSLKDGGARVEAQEDARRRVVGMLAALGVSCLVLPPSLVRRGT